MPLILTAVGNARFPCVSRHPVLSVGHRSFSRFLGAGSPCSLLCVHIYTCVARPPPVAVSLVWFHHLLPHMSLVSCDCICTDSLLFCLVATCKVMRDACLHALGAVPCDLLIGNCDDYLWLLLASAGFTGLTFPLLAEKAFQIDCFCEGQVNPSHFGELSPMWALQ